jgi:hypothetical protein
VTATSAVATLAPGLLVLLLSAATQEQQGKSAGNPDKPLTLSKKNPAAEELESFLLALGLDAHRKDPSAEHPSREDVEAYQRAGFGPWLDAQLKTANDSIASAPSSIRSFLEQRQPTLWRVVGLLERDVPEWDWGQRPDLDALLPIVTLAKILTAASLVEERGGRHVQAGELLEASWSLSRPLSERSDLTSQLIAISVDRFLAGALRKMSDPPVQWLDRMSGVEPWQRMLDALADRRPPTQDSGAEPDEDWKVYVRAWHVVADRLREMSPCEVSKLSSEEIWKPGQEELERRGRESENSTSAAPFLAFAAPNQAAMIRRAGRLLVDRELTARILEIRQEKAASREARWPGKFSDLESRVCPG